MSIDGRDIAEVVATINGEAYRRYMLLLNVPIHPFVVSTTDLFNQSKSWKLDKDYSVRTIERDLELLVYSEASGYVLEKVATEGRLNKWSWVKKGRK